ncbi:peptidyl-prolyl cis-trans isomerase FKBP17-2, chloroplastic-like [Panicum hallii]|uniref:peptidyl-prolyl cis-trans isomerase FKBP17-2, chloroplastic-like n=1 Tax=Panicum hallii TaxID=206008 RepID=UPI000DF4E7EB|nr:peptidyl-prolyl cis-trans isomerase FKBP17-2, chloroplastic-like [Panicum hallii]
MDWVASSLTRRFGICIGLAWAGFLAVGVVSEQLQTRFEVAQQQANTKSVLPCLTLACRSRAPQDVEQEQEVVLANGIRLKSQSAAGAQPRRPLAAAAGAQARG